MKIYASDIVNYAMHMAQQHAVNSFSFRDVHYLLNQHWRYVYERINQIESGFYSLTTRLSTAQDGITKIPPYVFNTIKVFRARDLMGSRIPYTEAGDRDVNCSGVYRLSGNDLYCYDARWGDMWCEYLPQPKTLFYTVHNRDPEIIQREDFTPLPMNDPSRMNYGMYKVLLANAGTNIKPLPSAMEDADAVYYRNQKFIATHKGNSGLQYDITGALLRETTFEGTYEWLLYDIVSVFYDFPYVFVSYKNRSTGQYYSVILRNLLGAVERYKYNAFDFNGRTTNAKFLQASYNDDTGMGVVLEDYDDIQDGHPVIKKLGFTPDTVVSYPHDCVADYLIAQLAKRFANRNESTILDIDHAIQLAEKEMNMFLKKDTNRWSRIENAVGVRITDIL